MKIKTSKSALKRVKCKNSLFSRKKAYRRHLLRRKNSKRLRRLCAPSQIHKSDFHAFLRMLPYSNLKRN